MAPPIAWLDPIKVDAARETLRNMRAIQTELDCCLSNSREAVAQSRDLLARLDGDGRPQRRKVTLELLRNARTRVAQGQERTIRQREVIGDLYRRGRDPSVAKLLLTSFEEVLAIDTADRDLHERDLVEQAS